MDYFSNKSVAVCLLGIGCEEKRREEKRREKRSQAERRRREFSLKVECVLFHKDANRKGRCGQRGSKGTMRAGALSKLMVEFAVAVDRLKVAKQVNAGSKQLDTAAAFIDAFLSVNASQLGVSCSSPCGGMDHGVVVVDTTGNALAGSLPLVMTFAK